MRKIRLYSAEKLANNANIMLTNSQTHYLLHVLRFVQDSEFCLFNERDGEFLARLQILKKQKVSANIINFIRAIEKEQNILFCFAPIKKLRLDYMIQKLVEMGVTNIQPVQTDYTQDIKLNYDKLMANIIEAAQQCGRISLPVVNKICSLQHLLNNWNNKYHLLFCDEKALVAENFNSLKAVDKDFAIIIGPEGGFSEYEQQLLLKQPFVSAISLGKNILRADTAAVASLALVNAALR